MVAAATADFRHARAELPSERWEQQVGWKGSREISTGLLAHASVNMRILCQIIQDEVR
jgi:hypothetical protein